MLLNFLDIFDRSQDKLKALRCSSLGELDSREEVIITRDIDPVILVIFVGDGDLEISFLNVFFGIYFSDQLIYLG